MTQDDSVKVTVASMPGHYDGCDEDGCCCFEPAIPTRCVMTFVGLVRSGEIKEKKLRAVQLGACITGQTAAFAESRFGGNLVGESTPEVMAAVESYKDLSLEECADKVEECINGVCPEKPELTVGVTPEAASFSKSGAIELIALILRMLLSVG